MKLNHILKPFKPIKELFFLDSGTLLGMYRDNQIIENDTDIDLFCLLKDSNEIHNFIKLYLHNYVITRQFYKKKLVKIICQPKFNSLRIDIHIFDPINNNNNSFAYKWIKSNSICQRIIKYIYFKTRPFLRKESLVFLEKLKLIEIKEWKYPICFHEKFKYLSGWKIPFETDKYLEFRYTKNWKNAAPNWNYWYDDGGLFR